MQTQHYISSFMHVIALASQYNVINFLSESLRLWKIVVSELCSRVFGLSRRTIRFTYCSKEYRRQNLIRRSANILRLRCKRFIQRMQNNSRKYPRKRTWNNANSETKCGCGSATSFHFGRTRRDDEMTLFWDNNARGKFSFFELSSTTLDAVAH